MTPLEQIRLRRQLRGPSVDIIMDFDRVAAPARSPRRRESPARHALVSFGPAFCVGLITIASALFPAASDRSGDDEGPHGPAAPTVALKARPLAAAMLDRVQSLVPGTGSYFAGQDNWLPNISTSGTAVAARFRFTPTATGDTGWIVIRVQAPAPSSSDALSCAGNLSDHPGGRTADCHREVQGDGSVLRDYTTTLVQPDGTVLVEHHADAIRDDDVLVLATSANTPDPDYGRTTRRALEVSGDPAVIAPRLRWITLWAAWGERLPAQYGVEGGRIDPFDDSPQSW